MRRRALWTIALGFSSLCSSASAEDFWCRFKLDFCRNNCWPQPFQATDRELTRTPLIAMTAAGWRLNNTLSDHFFRVEDQAINPAGEIKLRWIVTQAPPHRRAVFVLRGPTPEATTTRLANVQQMVDKLAIEGMRPEVALTHVIPPGASGDYFDQVDRQLKQSVPAPRLPDMQGAGGEN
jgi:hypothetical protein